LCAAVLFRPCVSESLIVYFITVAVAMFGWIWLMVDALE
jgi:hypothetical protein